jgi:hypothetical protein
MKQPKLGTGKRFSALRAALADKGVRDPDALAASIGMKKYGKAKMRAMAARGRQRAGND